jgi:HTH-type transcriptional regulator/antitoxin MqsA
MASLAKTLPDTMVSPETGAVLRRDVRPFIVTYKGKSRTVDLPGYHSDNGVDGIHIGDDMDVTDVALRALMEEIDGIPFTNHDPAPAAETEPVAARSRWNPQGLRKCLRHV